VAVSEHLWVPPQSSESGTCKTVTVSGLGFQVKVLKTFKVVPFSLGSGGPIQHGGEVDTGLRR